MKIAMGFKWPRRFSLRVVLGIGFISLIALIIALGLASLLGQDRSVKAVDRLLGVENRVAELSVRSTVAILKARRAEKDFMLFQNEFGFEEARARFITFLRTAVAEIHEHMSEIRELSDDRALAQQTREIEQAVIRYEASFLRIVDLDGHLRRSEGGLAGELHRTGEEIKLPISSGEHDRLMIELLRLQLSAGHYMERNLDRDAKAFVEGIAQFKIDLALTLLPTAVKDALAGLAQQYLALFVQYRETVAQIDAEEAIYLRAARTVEPLLERVYAATDQRAIETRSNVESVAEDTKITIIVASVIALVLGGSIAGFVSRCITRWLDECLAFAKQLAEGDWEIRLTPRGANEFGTLAIALNQMAEALHKSRNSLEKHSEQLMGSYLELQKEIAVRERIEEQLVRAQKMEALGRLTGGLSHDFNNLLGIIIGNLDLLVEMLKADPKASELIEDALEAGMRGADLNRRLLAFARRQPLQPKKLDINELIAGIAKLLDRTLGEDIEIRLSMTPHLRPVVVDPAQLEASITNLATNARDAMSRGGELLITTRNAHLDADYAEEHEEVVPGDYVVVEVTDTGTGMPPGVLARVFEPFFTTKGVGKGTGLGLSMVFGFVKQSSGHVQIYSEVGRGTTIRLYLPQAEDESTSEATEISSSSPPVRGSEVVLAVEDNERMRRVVVRQLSELGYCVLDANDARMALSILAREERIDLLFTDIVMSGGLSGWDLAREALALRPDLKVLFTSGFPDTAFERNGLLPDSYILLSKPYRKQDLAQKLREALAAMSPAAAPS